MKRSAARAKHKVSGGANNERFEKDSRVARSSHREGGRDGDGVGGRQPARAAGDRRVLDGDGEGGREALRRAAADPIEALRDSQATAARWLGVWSDGAKDP